MARIEKGDDIETFWIVDGDAAQSGVSVGMIVVQNEFGYHLQFNLNDNERV
jgi:hypothetical protein